MPKYQVKYHYTNVCVALIDADNEEQAAEIATEMDDEYLRATVIEYSGLEVEHVVEIDPSEMLELAD